MSASSHIWVTTLGHSRTRVRAKLVLSVNGQPGHLTSQGVREVRAGCGVFVTRNSREGLEAQAFCLFLLVPKGLPALLFLESGPGISALPAIGLVK